MFFFFRWKGRFKLSYVYVLKEVSPVIRLYERMFGSNLIIAHCLPGMRMGVFFTEDSVSVNNPCLVLRVQSPQIPSWTRRAEGGDSPSRILISCLGTRWKPMFCPQKWERKHRLMVHFWVFVLFRHLFLLPSPPPSLFGTVRWIWQTWRVIWGKHKPQWNSKYETFIHSLSSEALLNHYSLPGIKAQRSEIMLQF